MIHVPASVRPSHSHVHLPHTLRPSSLHGLMDMCAFVMPSCSNDCLSHNQPPPCSLRPCSRLRRCTRLHGVMEMCASVMCRLRMGRSLMTCSGMQLILTTCLGSCGTGMRSVMPGGGHSGARQMRWSGGRDGWRWIVSASGIQLMLTTCLGSITRSVIRARQKAARGQHVRRWRGGDGGTPPSYCASVHDPPLSSALLVPTTGTLTLQPPGLRPSALLRPPPSYHQPPDPVTTRQRKKLADDPPPVAGTHLRR